MQLVRRYRMPALFCALAVLLCELIAHPFAEMGICDDGPYILVAQHLAATGHIAYNGWSAAMLVWQLYLGAALIKIFGFSFTIVRMSTLVVAIATAFVLQRTLVRSGVSERTATFGTLALVLSPMYLMLSATFMSDIHGVFAIVLCLYGCLRALQSPTARAAISWLCFAVATNVLCGTSRQLAWLGALVMVPCTVWLLRAQRRLFFAGVAVAFAGYLSILFCMHWLKLQPYTTPEHFALGWFPVLNTLHQFASFFLDFPILLFPLALLFWSQIRKSRLRVASLIVLVGWLFLTVYPSHLRGVFSLILEPTFYDWVTPAGNFSGSALRGNSPVFLTLGVRVVLTLAALGGLLGLIASFFNTSRSPHTFQTPGQLSWKSLAILLGPFTLAYITLLVYRAITIANAGTPEILDRYALGLLVTAVVVLARYYQERIQLRLPLAMFVFIAITAAYGVVVTHNTFAFYRARVALAAELRAVGIPDTSVDNGWEDNIDVELQQAGHVNNPGIVDPADAYEPVTPPDGICKMFWYNYTPHIHPIYGVSFDPNACYGPAPFEPVHYSRWLASSSGTLYAIWYIPASNP